jgi:hypothetical protein
MPLSPTSPASASLWKQSNLLRIMLLLTISTCLALSTATANAQVDDDPTVEDPAVDEPPMEEEEFSLDDEEFAPVDDFAGSAPQMVGDFGGGSMFYTLGGFVGSDAVQTPIAIAGGSRRIKIAENNQVTPLNRVYATYNHFHNAFVLTERTGEMGAAAGTYSDIRSQSIDQYTIGMEKAFGCGRYSVELRMPFTGGLGVDFNSAVKPGNALNTSTGSVGNLAINLKALVYESCRLRAAIGCGINTPTGSDVSILSADFDEDVIYNLVVHNDAVHFLPWAGFHSTPRERLWLQGFAQLDIAANGNRVTGSSTDFIGNPDPDIINGAINEQTLLYLDLQAGYWLYQDCCPCATGLTALAAMLELHYTTALNNADYIALPFGGAIGNPGASTPGFVNRFDVVNLTAGLRFELSNTWKINAAGVVPLKSGHFNAGGRVLNRFFDAEAVLQVNREF